MEKNYKFNRRALLNFVLSVLGVLLLMYTCVLTGYFLAKKSASSQKRENAPYVQTEGVNEDKPFPNLPVNITSIYEEEEEPDNNDYLIISEGNLVNLYLINENGDKIFESVLEIDINSLTEDDKSLLKSGIVLSDKESLLSVIEDYTS